MSGHKRTLAASVKNRQLPYRACQLIGLGGLFAGVTGPLLRTFIPPLVRDALGDHRTTIGAVMAIDNVLLLLLVPWTRPASDRAVARGRGRLPLVLAGLVLSSLGMALLPSRADSLYSITASAQRMLIAQQASASTPIGRL